MVLSIASVISTPIALIVESTKGVIFEPLHSAFMPYVWECAKIMLYVGCIQGAYFLMRADTKQSVDKIKFASMGYILIRFIDVFVRLVDSVATNMKF